MDNWQMDNSVDKMEYGWMQSKWKGKKWVKFQGQRYLMWINSEVSACMIGKAPFPRVKIVDVMLCNAINFGR